MDMLEQSPRAILKYYYIRFSLELVLLFLIVSGVIYFTHTHQWAVWLNRILGASLVLSFLFYAIRPWILLKYRYFALSQNHVRTLNTFFFKKEAIVKIERIQFLKRKNGPLLRSFGLCKNSIVTAGHELQLPLMSKDKTIEIEKYCMSYLEKVDADV